MTYRIRTRLIARLAVVSLVAPALPALASSLKDLEGVRASSAESSIMSRGYYAHHSARADDGRYTYWWNNGSKSCERTLTVDGRIAKAKSVDATDCSYYGDDAKKSGSGNGAAAAAVAAAALIGVLALSHKSHHRKDRDYQDPQGLADFERGHRDGLYNHTYDSYSRSDAYGDGYRSGVEEREQQSSYRRNNYGGGYGGNDAGGYGSQAGYSDLVGSRAAGVESDLQSRGFRSVDGFQSGNGKGTVWWNGRSRQCLQMITVDGRADSITDIQTHPRCR